MRARLFLLSSALAFAATPACSRTTLTDPITNAASGCAPGLCGDDLVQPDVEPRDDGNTSGSDGCAANCKSLQ